MLKNKKKRSSDDINAGSMADIAFLLLIFFLVTTTISAEKGIMAKLPPYDPDPPKKKWSGKNVLSVKVNKDNDLMVESQQMHISELREMTKKFIMNKGVDPNLSSSPSQAIVSLQNDRATSYNSYISVYNEVKGAYNELWEDEAQDKYQKSYEVLTPDQKRAIQEEIPLIISEAEPVEIK